MNPNLPPPMNKMLIGVIALPLSSYPPEVRRGATSGLQRTCLNTLRVRMCIQMHIESYGIYLMFTKMYLYMFMYIYIYTHAFQRGVMVCEYVVSISVSPYCISISLYVNLFTVHIYKQSLERHISNEKHLPQLMLLGYMPLWQELQTFDILGFQRAPSPTSCMTHVWDVCEIISFFWYIHNSLDVENSPVICWCLFVLCNAESPFQQEMRRECVPDYVAPSLGHVMGIGWDLPTFWIFRWLFEDHAPVGRRTNMIKIWSLRTTIDYSERRLKYVEDLK